MKAKGKKKSLMGWLRKGEDMFRFEGGYLILPSITKFARCKPPETEYKVRITIEELR
jgi:hypothetical protein